MSADLTERVLEVLRKVLPAGQIGEEAAFGVTDEWDSLKHVEVILGIEREFGVKVGAANFMSLTNVRAIARFLDQRGVGDVSR